MVHGDPYAGKPPCPAPPAPPASLSAPPPPALPVDGVLWSVRSLATESARPPAPNPPLGIPLLRPLVPLDPKDPSLASSGMRRMLARPAMPLASPKPIMLEPPAGRLPVAALRRKAIRFARWALFALVSTCAMVAVVFRRSTCEACGPKRVLPLGWVCRLPWGAAEGWETKLEVLLVLP